MVCTVSCWSLAANRLIKNLTHPGLFAARVIIRIFTVARVSVLRLLHIDGMRRNRLGTRAIKQFVEFTAIQPYAAALWTVVNFDTLTIGHGEYAVRAGRAFHHLAPKVLV